MFKASRVDEDKEKMKEILEVIISVWEPVWTKMIAAVHAQDFHIPDVRESTFLDMVFVLR